LQEQGTGAADDSAVHVTDDAAPVLPPRPGTEEQPARAHHRAGRIAGARARAAAAATAAIVSPANAPGVNPDLYAILSLTEFPVINTRFPIRAKVTSKGQVASPAGTPRVWTDSPQGAITCSSIPPKSTTGKMPSVAHGASAWSTAITIKAPATPGTHDVTVFLDTCSTGPSYAAECSLECTVLAAPGASFNTYAKAISPANPVVGEAFKIAMYLWNQRGAGGPNPKPFRLRLYLNTEGAGFTPTCNQTDYAPSILSDPITKKIGVGTRIEYVFTVPTPTPRGPQTTPCS